MLKLSLIFPKNTKSPHQFRPLFIRSTLHSFQAGSLGVGAFGVWPAVARPWLCALPKMHQGQVTEALVGASAQPGLRGSTA